MNSNMLNRFQIFIGLMAIILILVTAELITG